MVTCEETSRYRVWLLLNKNWKYLIMLNLVMDFLISSYKSLYTMPILYVVMCSHVYYVLKVPVSILIDGSCTHTYVYSLVCIIYQHNIGQASCLTHNVTQDYITNSLVLNNYLSWCLISIFKSIFTQIHSSTGIAAVSSVWSFSNFPLEGKLLVFEVSKHWPHSIINIVIKSVFNGKT